MFGVMSFSLLARQLQPLADRNLHISAKNNTLICLHAENGLKTAQVRLSDTFEAFYIADVEVLNQIPDNLRLFGSLIRNSATNYN